MVGLSFVSGEFCVNSLNPCFSVFECFHSLLQLLVGYDKWLSAALICNILAVLNISLIALSLWKNIQFRWLWV